MLSAGPSARNGSIHVIRKESHDMLARFRTIALVVVFGIGASATLEAQAPSFAADTTSLRQAAPAPGPTVSASAVALRAPAQLPAADERQRQADDAAGARMTTSQTLMIVGGAMFLAGAVIGGDAGTIIMIGGAGIGLWGLYQYLQ